MPKSWTSGDVHYWDVWWGQKPFATYKDAVGRFMSEYGFQSFPDLTTVKKYAKKEDWDIFSEVMKAHQRSSIGNGTIANYMKRHYKDPKDFPSFLYVGQLLQARGIKTAIQAQRKARPYCMGSLYWQLDDCWPVASWSGIDYYGRWKALHYAVKKAFDDYLIVPELINDSVMVSLISDKYKDTSVKFKLILFDFSGNVLWNIEERMKLPAASSNLIFSEQLDDILKEMPEERVLLNALLFNEKGELLADNILYFVPPKELELPENKITFKVDKADDGYQITLHTDKLAKNVYLSFDEDVNGMFSDNYFDLLPAKKKEVYFYTNDDIQNLNKQIKIITLIDTYE